MPPRLARSPLDDRSRPGDPDMALVTRAQRGDRDAFEELVRRHADRLYGVIHRFGLPRDAAQEVTQETFLRAWRSVGSFKGDAHFFTWLYRIGLNEAKRRLQRDSPRAVVRSIDEEAIAEPRDSRDEPHPRAAHAELRGALATAVRSLSPKYRAPLILRDIEGLSTADAAAILGLSEAAFKSRLHRARSAVRDAIRHHLDGPQSS